MESNAFASASPHEKPVRRLSTTSAAQEKLRKLKSAQILRSLAQKTSFGSAAVEVVSKSLPPALAYTVN